MFDKFTDRARKVILIAREESKRLNYEYVGCEHILLGLIKEGNGIAVAALKNMGVDLKQLQMRVEKTLEAKDGVAMMGEIPFTPRAKKVLELAIREAQQLGHNYVGTEHILLGLVKEGEGVAAQLLAQSDVTLEKARFQVAKLLGGVVSSPGGRRKSSTPVLDEFGADLTMMAEQSKLDPTIGRDDEIERVLQILSRRKKNNPVLIGEPGVGKTAIAEGLAQRIVNGSVPEVLHNKRIVTLDLGAIVAGTKYRGQFEERLRVIMDEIRKSDDVIIFIDELHTLIGAGGAEGAMDAANMLKPSLSRGELQCIGATTLREYKQYVEKDGALERRFQTVIVDAPSVEETIDIIKGLRDRYEDHHKAKILDEAIVAAANFADRYITDRFLPDKAIDLIDEAGSRVRLTRTSVPEEVRELERELDGINKEKESVIQNQEFERAASLRDREKSVGEKLEKAKEDWDKAKSGEDMAEVTADDVAYIVSKWTKIPVAKLEETESDKLLRMEEPLKERIVGQDEAVVSLAKALRRSRAGLSNPHKPIGTFIFLGPTGVGKTELTKALAEFMFEDENAIIRLDMSEFMERFAVSRLIGSPPGYVGYEQGGQLTEKVRRKPYSIVVLDEIEKAHPDVFNILLQVMDEGNLTDGQGRTVDFKNTIIIMTSNLGTRDIKKSTTSLGFQQVSVKDDYEKMKEVIVEELKKTFGPEFLNRIDDVIVFHQLAIEDIRKIVDLELLKVQKLLQEKEITVQLSGAAKDFLIEKGYDPDSGARSLRRVIQRYVEDILSEAMLKGDYQNGGIVHIDLIDNELKVMEETPVAA